MRHILMLALFSVSSSAFATTSISVEGGGVDIGQDLEASPPFLAVATQTLDPVVVTITPSANESVALLTYSPANFTGTDWSGLEFVLQDAMFAAAPLSLVTPTDSTFLGNTATVSNAVFLSGGIEFINLTMLPPDEPYTLTVTPIVPEPATLLISLLGGAILVGSRRTRASQ